MKQLLVVLLLVAIGGSIWLWHQRSQLKEALESVQSKLEQSELAQSKLKEALEIAQGKLKERGAAPRVVKVEQQGDDEGLTKSRRAVKNKLKTACKILNNRIWQTQSSLQRLNAKINPPLPNNEGYVSSSAKSKYEQLCREREQEKESLRDTLSQQKAALDKLKHNLSVVDDLDTSGLSRVASSAEI